MINFGWAVDEKMIALHNNHTWKFHYFVTKETSWL